MFKTYCCLLKNKSIIQKRRLAMKMFIKNYYTSVTRRTAAPLSRLKPYFGLTCAELIHTKYALLELIKI